ncbi:MarR family transcriptional regulator [Microcoleus sp. bin48.metabat.b7b8b9.023]
MLLSRSNLTHLVDRLEKAGLLYRERCPRDRHGFRVLW